MCATLFLIPSTLGKADIDWLPVAEQGKIMHLTHFVVEAKKTARQHLKALGIHAPLCQLHMELLDKHTPPEAMAALLSPLQQGKDIGLMSEAGCPGIADPGAQLVALAHAAHYRVHPLIGPSAIILALMASGANGQRFSFHGYLPIDTHDRIKHIKALEQRSKQYLESQIFIETPYRNQTLLQQLRAYLSAHCRLAVACDLTLPSQHIMSQRIKDWPQRLPNLHKRPAVFIIDASH